MPLRTMHLAITVGVTAAAGALVVLGACASVPDTNYGTPGSLTRNNLPGEGGVEALLCPTTGTGDGGGGGGGGGDGGGGNCAVSFNRDIFPNMKKEGPWKCGDSACHAQGANKPFIDVTTSTAAYDSMKDYQIKNAASTLITTSGDPQKSMLECNLLGQCGTAMPQAPGRTLTHEELCMIDAWLRCGAPNN